MAEILGIVAGASQLFDSAIRIIKSLKQAYNRQQEQADFLDRYRLELLVIKEQVEKIRKEKALATPTIIGILLRLKGPEERLVKWLTQVDRSGKKAICKFIDQLVHGSEDRKKLEEILDDLNRAKFDLNLAITIANAGRARNMEKKLKASKLFTKKRDKSPSNSALHAKGQPILGLFRRRSVSLELINSDVSSKGSGDGQSINSSTDSDISTYQSSRVNKVVEYNSSDNGAVIINARIGPGDTWMDLPVKICHNKADNKSFMVNYSCEESGIEVAMRLQKQWTSSSSSS